MLGRILGWMSETYHLRWMSEKRVSAVYQSRPYKKLIKSLLKSLMLGRILGWMSETYHLRWMSEKRVSAVYQSHPYKIGGSALIVKIDT